MKKLNILKYLEREDKWYLGGGNRLIWTPPFPVWLDYPGFWDKAHYYNYEIEPVFTWTVLDEDGNEIPLRANGLKWDPSKLITRFKIDDGELKQRAESREFRALSIEESKCCLPNDVLTSIVRVRNKSNKTKKLHFIAWTIQQSYPSKQTTWLSDVDIEKNKINFTKHLHRDKAPTLPIGCSFGFNRRIESFSVNLSEGQAIQPHWRFTPFYEKFQNGKLPNEVKLSGANEDGLIFMALHESIELRAKSEECVVIYFSAAPTKRDAKKNFQNASNHENPIEVSDKNWNDFFASVPYFECSDEYITRYYWYRWYGLKLNTINVKEGNYKHPAVCEGIGYFRAPISYSAMCHMLDNRWRHDPKLAQGSLLTFIENQRKDGGFRGYIDMNYYRQEMFYHSNWGKAVRGLYRIHPDKQFLKKAYDGLVKYVCYFDRERDAEGSGLYDIDNHYETGQEYMHRYLAVDPHADGDNWGKNFRLKGVDVTVYIYELKKALEWMAKEIHRRDAEIAVWRNGAGKIKQAILEKMWDQKGEMFFDVDPKTGKRTDVKASICFYPYMTDIVSEEHLPGLKKHLLNPEEFWTTYPVPSSSVDDKYFSAEAEWKGERMNCPWNGRVWPMTSSHIAEALAQSAIRFNSKELRTKSVEFINKFIRMMFFNGDPQRPNCFEHYNPYSGQPSIYRGIDDYQHSWIVDLIIKYVVGFRPADGKIVIDPFRFDIEELYLNNIYCCGHQFAIFRKGNRITVWMDGKLVRTSILGTPIILELP
jgi:hypothetical protein